MGCLKCSHVWMLCVFCCKQSDPDATMCWTQSSWTCESHDDWPEFNALAFVNCTGLNSGPLCDANECYPLQGALVRLIIDGSRFLLQLHEVFDNILIDGGVAQPNEWDEDLILENFPKFNQQGVFISNPEHHTGDLIENGKTMPDEFNADIIVNFTGLNGGFLCDDNECYSL